MKCPASTIFLAALVAGSASALPYAPPLRILARGVDTVNNTSIAESKFNSDAMSPALQAKISNVIPAYVQKGTVTEDEINKMIEDAQGGAAKMLNRRKLITVTVQPSTSSTPSSSTSDDITTIFTVTAQPSISSRPSSSMLGSTTIPRTFSVSVSVDTVVIVDGSSTATAPSLASTSMLNSGGISATNNLSATTSIPPPGVVSGNVNSNAAVPSSMPPATTTFAPADMSGQGPFVSMPSLLGSTARGADFTIDGPFLSIEIYPGETSLRGFSVSDIDGNITTFGDSTTANGADSPGKFTMDEDEKVIEMHFQIKNNIIGGLHFSTSKGNKYNASSTITKRDDSTWYRRSWTEKSINVGSGMFGRFHGILGPVSREIEVSESISALGIEFVDTIESIKMVSVSYPGFSSAGSIDAASGKELNAGSQVLDNRNSSVEQTFTLALRKDVYTTYTYSLAISAMVGYTISASATESIPELVSATEGMQAQWQLTITATATFTHTDVISQGANFNLACPAGKFCEGDAIFFTYELKTDYIGDFELTTKSGRKMRWQQPGTFTSSDMSDMKLVVNEYQTDPDLGQD